MTREIPDMPAYLGGFGDEPEPKVPWTWLDSLFVVGTLGVGLAVFAVFFAGAVYLLAGEPVLAWLSQ